jgi:cellobiose-specific phosphotransferase system component IIC
MWLALEKLFYDFSKRSQEYLKELRENVIARRNFYSVLILGFMLLMILVYLFDETYKGKKTTISIFSLAFFFIMGYLQYQNSRDKATIHNSKPHKFYSIH